METEGRGPWNGLDLVVLSGVRRESERPSPANSGHLLAETDNETA
jgi:hypothetical protein